MSVGMKVRRCLGTILLAVLILAGMRARRLTAHPLSQAQDRRYFESGYWISGDFRDYFETNGELEIFGYPITAPYMNDDGVFVQYFQNARIEYHAANPAPYRVQLGLLGDELGYRQPPARPPTTLSPRKVYFPETGHTVSYMFLDYFREHGGINIFGYPISEMFIENQRIVQYFQRLKLVWDVQTSEVTVGNLGEVYVAANRDRIPPNTLEPADFRFGEQGVQDLRVVIDLARSVVSSRRSQGVRLVVLDDRMDDPVADAQISLFLEQDTDGASLNSLQILSTDARGRAEATFALTGVKPGSWVVVRADVTYGGITASQTQLFLVWW
jgi:hypothetical protein